MAFITPGGHRRYSRTELKKFIGLRQKVLSVKELAAELEDTVQLHREISRLHLSSISWYHKLGQESQQQLAQSSRRLRMLAWTAAPWSRMFFRLAA